MDDKRSLDSLVAQYQLEPTLVDIYVEGERDRAMLEWFLNRQSASGVTVCSVDLIDIPDTVLQNHGLTKRSNRSKVIALAIELSSQCQNDIRVLCVADRDFEDSMPSASMPPLLCLTDGHSMESYAFNEVCLGKFTSVVLGGFVLSANELLSCLARVLREVYAIRLANEILGWGMKYLPFTGYCSVVGRELKFDKDGFLRAYLQKNRRWSDRNRFAETLRECSAKLPLDITRTARGHDLSELLFYVIAKLRRDRKFGNSETLEGALLGSVEAQDLLLFPLFQRIEELIESNRPA